MRVSLEPVSGGSPFVLEMPMAVVGSGDGCDFLVTEEGIPEMCCVLVLTDNLVLVRDLETGLVRVNGQSVRRAVLLPDDRFSVGEREFVVRYDEG